MLYNLRLMQTYQLDTSCDIAFNHFIIATESVPQIRIDVIGYLTP